MNKTPSDNSLPPFAFFGTPKVARDTLTFLSEVGIEPSVILTNAPAPKGRGRIVTQTQVAEFAHTHYLPIFTPPTLTPEHIKEICSYNCAFAIVVAYGKIFPETLIQSFPLGVINVHYSLLPKYRGASPVETALVNGETTTGVSLQYMKKALDDGDIIASVQVPIAQTDTSRELFEKLIRAGAILLRDNLPTISAGTATMAVQDANMATYAPKIQKEAGCLSEHDDALASWNKYRAYSERPGVYFYAVRDGKRIRVKVRGATYAHGVFTITRVTPEGKSEQAYDDFLRARWRAQLL